MKRPRTGVSKAVEQLREDVAQLSSKKVLILIALVVLVFFGAGILLKKPSNERDWSEDQRILPKISVSGDRIEIENIRNFSYTSPEQYTAAYYDKEFDLAKLRRVWFMLEHLSSAWRGPAHTLLSFEFEGPEFLAVSIEVRKQVGQTFSPIKGLLRQYELMYVIADEGDVIRLRTDHRKNQVHLYPIVAEEDHLRELLLHMLDRADALQQQPEFYNTFTNNCTTNIVQHVRTLVPGSIPLSYKVLLPGYLDELLYDIGLLDSSDPFAEAKNRALLGEGFSRPEVAPD